MTRLNIDLNCDMGEGFEATEEAIMPYVSSINIACGAHAGGIETIKHTLEKAQKYGVFIGAHPGYMDKESFGRKNQFLSKPDLRDLIRKQLDLIFEVAQKVNHVKLHGALYNQSATDLEMSECIFQEIKSYRKDLKIYGLANSCHISAAKALDLVYLEEAFIDRTYQNNGTLTPRSLPNAIIVNKEEALAQALMISKDKKVKTLDGSIIPLNAQTLCIHGDSEHAALFAKEVFRVLSGLQRH